MTKDAAGWLERTFAALTDQTYPRLDVIAIDSGSSDDSPRLLEAALGPERVLRVEGNGGFSVAIAKAMRSQLAAAADYLLFLRAGTVLSREAIENLVWAAERIDGTGVVGPKVLDWREPDRLREIGFSTDRFGYAYSPLEAGEIDHGQYDRAREVLFVSSRAMLVSKEALTRIGLPDDRLASHEGASLEEDLDFCWRARLAGFGVVMMPRAVARNGASERRGDGLGGRARARYYRERGALASILKNYGWRMLFWVLPLYLIQGLVRVALLVLGRRFEDALQVLGAWGWNLLHLPGTFNRRVRAQAVRAVPDAEVRRLMAPAGIRLRRWAQAAGQLLLRGPGVEEEDERIGAGRRLVRFAGTHPATVAWSFAIILALLAYRNLLPASPLSGGSLAGFPSGPSEFFREFASALRHTGLGGTTPASPALGILGVGSVLALGSPALLQKLLLLGLPAVAGLVCYRSVRAVTGDRLAAILSGFCYGLSAAVLWALSEGRIPELVLLAGTPWLATKLGEAFRRQLPLPLLRWVVGAGLGLAVLASFFPGAALAAAVVAVSWAMAPIRGLARARGVALAAAAVALASLLAVPVTNEVLRSAGDALSGVSGGNSFAEIARLSPGRAPGSWLPALYLPAAAALGLAFVSGRLARAGVPAAISGVSALYLAWLSSWGYLPAPLSNEVAYVAVAAFSFAFLVGLGIASLVPGVSRESFGHRQVAASAMTLLVVTGLGAQSFQAARGAWGVGGPERLPVTYPLVTGAAGPPFRVLWLGAGEDPLPAPAGASDGSVGSGRRALSFAVGYRSGSTALDFGRPAVGPGYDYLRRAISEIVTGATAHGGALLAPLAIRFIVAERAHLPGVVLGRLRTQLDLDQLPVGELAIFVNHKRAPLASQIRDAEWQQAAFDGNPLGLPSLPVPHAQPLQETRDTFVGETTGSSSLVLLSQQFAPGWRLIDLSGGERAHARPAFGWAVGFPAETGTEFQLAFVGQRGRTLQSVALIALWLAALWITRKPARVREGPSGGE